jgi:hypothetical protein
MKYFPDRASDDGLQKWRERISMNGSLSVEESSQLLKLLLNSEKQMAE